MKPIYPAIGDGVTIRLACCVPFCRRTFRFDKNYSPWPENHIIMCGHHWRAGNPALKAHWRRARRLLKKAERLVDTKRREFLVGHLSEREWKAWDAVRDSVVQRALGIG